MEVESQASKSGALDQLFDLIIFDWDGTAVTDRSADARELIAALRRLLGTGPICAVVTGTKIENIVAQGIGDLSSFARRLFICTNRGSEVYSFNEAGKLERVFRREATTSERQALDESARRLRNIIDAHNLETEIIFNRLNRAKVDLIPIPRWMDPKKSEFRELVQDVQNRLGAMGIAGGIAELIDAAKRVARSTGLSDPKITSDIKHIEIGLTDKSDSIRWIHDSVIIPQRIPQKRVILWGDEFGSIGGISGSDALMHIPELPDSVYVSVGVEPEGTPPWVMNLGGGPRKFLNFLDGQYEARLQQGGEDLGAFEERDPSWLIEQDGFDPTREREMETLFTVSNGYLGVRGASDFPIPAAQADLIVAGIYDKKVNTVPYSEPKILTTFPSESLERELAPFPSPLRWKMAVDGAPLSASSPEMYAHQRKLDLKNGIYREEHGFVDPQGRKTRVRTLRLASMSDPHLLLQETEIFAVNFASSVSLDLAPSLEGFTSLYPHLETTEEEREAWLTEFCAFHTLGSRASCYVATKAFLNGKLIDGPALSVSVKPGERLRIRRFIAVYTSRDGEKSLAAEHLKSSGWDDWPCQIRAHGNSWKKVWEESDIQISGCPELTQAQRFNAFHLRSAAGPAPRFSIPARALSGRAYEGHIFWDTEIFMFPFFLYNAPAIAKELLLYRHRTLPGARKRALEMGFAGACFAWESTLSGEDVTPRSVAIAGSQLEIPIFTGPQQIHVSADVAYAVWRYWDATRDEDFMLNFGAEILIETARFWASRAEPADGRYHISAVVGPDEYHNSVTDNAFTNWMAKFNLQHALFTVEWLSQREPLRYGSLAERVGLQASELEEWKAVEDRLFIPTPNAHGVIEQFRGFFDLKAIRLSESERMRAPISRLFNWREVNGLQLLKQADVLMIPFLFPGALPQEVVKANYLYYEPKTDHGSSLSPSVHAAVAAQIGSMEVALRYWRLSLNLDLNNTMANTELGIHAAALGGTWQALVFHLLGARLSENGIIFPQEGLTPAIPPEWGEVQLQLTYRGKRSSIRLGPWKREAA